MEENIRIQRILNPKDNFGVILFTFCTSVRYYKTEKHVLNLVDKEWLGILKKPVKPIKIIEFERVCLK